MKVEIKKEIANAVTHGIGLITFITLIPILFVKASHYEVNYKIVGLIFFSIGLIMVYASSTIYHAIMHEKAKYILRIADHISIYYLIAGSYTAILMTSIPFEKIKWFIIVLWSIVLIGTVTIIAFNSGKVLLFLLLGGLFYLLGVIFYAWKKFTYHHAVWHLFVLTGSIMHFFGVWFAIEQ